MEKTLESFRKSMELTMELKSPLYSLVDFLGTEMSIVHSSDGSYTVNDGPVVFCLKWDEHQSSVYLYNLFSSDKKKGYCRHTLTAFLEVCDKTSTPIRIDAINSAGGMGQNKLEAFYRSLGFKNLGGSNTMIYTPEIPINNR